LFSAILLICYVPLIPAHRRVFGANLRRCRKRAKFTQEKLAEKTGLSVVFISLLENGWRTASLDTLLSIARVLKVKLPKLLHGIK